MRASIPALFLLSCTTGEPEAAVDPVPTGDGIFLHGCPVASESRARLVVDPEEQLAGKWAVGTVGDALLMNEQAAFVITRPDADTTYWYYGGVVADAAALDGCTQLNDDKLEEIGLVLGQLDVAGQTESRVRAFRGDTMEVLADGSDGGDAIVRVTGTDATHWLVEYTLQAAAAGGSGRAFDVSYGSTVTVDYILSPDSPVLTTVVTVDGTEATPEQLFGAMLVTFGDTLDVHRYATSGISFSGLNLSSGIPWAAASDGAGAYAIAVGGVNMASMTISGVDILLDVDQALVTPIEPHQLGANQYVNYLSVGATDANSAVHHLQAVHATPVRDHAYTNVPIAGTVTDSNSGAPIAGATIRIQAQAPDAGWGDLDELRTDATGAFSGELPDFDTGWALRLQPSTAGRNVTDPTAVDLQSNAPIPLTLPPLGTLSFSITDTEGTPMASRVELVRDDGLTSRQFLFDSGDAPIPPGSWTWTATRGFEYAPVTGEVTVPESGSATLTVVLDRVIDTTGYLSADTHIHSEGSPDSRVMRTRQLLVAASHGLEIPVSTDHEKITSFADDLVAAGLDGLMGVVAGEEVTAVVPEHMTMFPTPPDGTERGGPVRWYGLDLEELVHAQRERGAGVVLLNHPGVLDQIGWDRQAGAPTRDDPESFGLSADAVLWSWDMDGLEVANGNGAIMYDGNGRFDDWMSMLNHGHPMTAVGASDDHGGTGTGFPCTWWASSTDDPTAFSEEEMVDSYVNGRAIVSMGAFARVTVNDEAEIGDLITDTDGQASVQLRIDALEEIAITSVKVFVDCDEVATLPADDPDGIIKLDTEVVVDITGDSHIVVAAFGEGGYPRGLPSTGSTTPRVFTNAIFVDGDGDGAWDGPGGKSCTYDLP